MSSPPKDKAIHIIPQVLCKPATMATSSYLERLSSLIGHDTYRMLFPKSSPRPETTLIQDYGNGWDFKMINDPNFVCGPAIESGVIVVREIDLATTALLGTVYDIDPRFFAHHALRMRDDICSSGTQDTDALFESLYVEGPRMTPSSSGFTLEHSSSCTEALQKGQTCEVLILVENPTSLDLLWKKAGQSDPVPSISQEAYSLHAFLLSFFSAKWSRQLLNSVHKVLHKETSDGWTASDENARTVLGALCLLLSIGSLDITLSLKSTFIDILALSVLDRPGMDVLADLGYHRRDLHHLKFHMEFRRHSTSLTIKKWALDAHTTFMNEFNGDQSYLLSFHSNSCDAQWDSLRRNVDDLYASLNDSFQTLIGAMTVSDSAANKKQAERATMLTLMAAIYLPLTLATGIFGMNIREIEQGAPSWWWVIIIMVVLLTPSVIFVVYLFTKNRLETFLERRAEMKNDKMV